MKRPIVGRALALGLLLLTATAQAESSNRSEVRSNLERGGWQVIWGHNFTEGDWAEGTAAIAASAACECPGPFLKWFDFKVEQMITHLQRSLNDVGAATIRNWISQSLNQRRLITYRGLQIQAGWATYNRWQDNCIRLPNGRNLCAGCVTLFGRRYCADKTPLPNWHQFYIRYKLQGDTGPGPGPGITWGKVCTMARRASDSFTYYAWDTNPNASWDAVCDRARSIARNGSPGRAVTHYWRTTFDVNGRNQAIAECMNGTWTHVGNGLAAVHEVNAKRKRGGGNGCLFKVQK